MNEREARGNVRPFRPHVDNVIPMGRRLRQEEWQALGDPYAERCAEVIGLVWKRIGGEENLGGSDAA